MGAWQELTSVEYDDVWTRFVGQFHFRPSVLSEEWPGITEPTPSATHHFEYPIADADIEDLHDAVLAAFRACLAPDDCLYALDWQHISYWFWPHVPIERWEGPGFWEGARAPGVPAMRADRWRVPVLPNGDYYIFVSRELSWGLFGHPWQQTICVFGERLLTALEAHEPSLFRDVVRRK